uniref:Uncharacterized protein n=1 Tax=Octopus bimaculoides TaxID=37653 RepID=A0A0L8I6U0_OCTBM
MWKMYSIRLFSNCKQNLKSTPNYNRKIKVNHRRDHSSYYIDQMARSIGKIVNI